MADVPGWVRPMLAVPDPGEPLGDSAWSFEVKWDGARVIASVDGSAAALWSRHGRPVTASFPEVADAVTAATAARQAIIDGEVVALDSEARPDFGRLQHRLGRDAGSVASSASVTFMVFDVMQIDGESTMSLPYVERRAALEALVESGPTIHVPPVLEVPQAAALEVSHGLGLEGVMAKRRQSPYRPGVRSPDWRKLLPARTVSAAVVGWNPGVTGMGSLLLAVPEASGALRYVGRVGSGMTDVDRSRFRRELGAAARPTPAVRDVPADIARNAMWVEPHVVVDVEYRAWTQGGRLRHPVFRRVRPDLRVEDL